MNFIRQRRVFDKFQLVGRHCENLDGLTLIELLQTNSLPIPKFHSIPVRGSVGGKLAEGHTLFF